MPLILGGDFNAVPPANAFDPVGAPVDSKYSDHQALVGTVVECATGDC